VKRVPLLRTLRGLARCAAACAFVPLALAAQNPATDHVVFLHGLLADSMSWLNTSNRLATEFNFTPHRFSINYFPHETVQAQTLATDLTTLPGNMAAVAKSNGALVIRTYLQNPGKVNRFVTVAGPNLGAPLADNVLSGKVFLFPRNVAVDVNTAAGFFYANDPNAPQVLDYFLWALKNVSVFFADILEVLSDYGLVLQSLAASKAPVALDLSPSSAAVQSLNSTAGLASVASRTTARVELAADFGVPRDMLFYTLLNGVAPVLAASRGVTADAAVILWYHYTYELDPYAPESFYLQSHAYLWEYVWDDMQNVDTYWLSMIGALAGVSPDGRIVRYDSSDGIVPVRNAVLNGKTRAYRVGNTSHQILNDDPGVYQALRGTMTLFGIPARTTQVNSVTVTPLVSTIAVTKTTQLQAKAYDVLGNVVSGRPTTWTSGTPSVATVSSTGLVTGLVPGQSVVTAKIDGYSATGTIVVTAAPPPGITNVSIGGPGVVRGGSVCTWTATVTGGTAPYSYRWTKNGVAVGDDLSSLTLSTPTSQFTLALTVTDSHSSSKAGSRTVSVSSSAAVCVQGGQ
jgi:pimeloyl-ACP methyl ester carboxylesterase